MTRILFFAPNYLPATRYGGPVRSTHGLAKALVAAGHAVDVLTTDLDGPQRLDVRLDQPVEMDGVSVHYCPISAPRRLYYSPAIAQRAADLIPLADAVHINGVFLWPGPYLARMARAQGKALVISPRGMLEPKMIAGRSRLIKKAWISLQERANLAAATAIHVTSESEAQGLRSMGLDLAPVAVIGNGVELPETLPGLDEISEIWGDVPPGRRVAFLGRLDWTKGVDMAIEATRAHSDAVIRLAGYDQIGLRAQLEPRLRRPDGSRCGDFLGPLDGRRKWAFLVGADVLLMPSVRESFGMSAAEALAVGTPVIATEDVGIATLLRRLDRELVVPRDQAALNTALAEFLRDHTRQTRIRKTLGALVTSDLAWPAISGRIADLYAGCEGAL